MPHLEIERLSVGYGGANVLHDISLEVRPGEVVTILGANGAGKTSLLNAVMGIIPRRSGTVRLDGTILEAGKPERLVTDGLVLVPERRELFGTLCVEDNLKLGAFARYRDDIPTSLDRVYSLFPILRERRMQSAATLSGGEQQMLAVGRAMMSKPRMLLLDEPSTGLAPKIVQEIFEIIKTLRSDGLTVLIVEQNARLALELADRGYVLDLGRISLSGTSAELSSNERLAAAYLGGGERYSDIVAQSGSEIWGQ